MFLGGNTAQSQVGWCVLMVDDSALINCVLLLMVFSLSVNLILFLTNLWIVWFIKCQRIVKMLISKADTFTCLVLSKQQTGFCLFSKKSRILLRKWLKHFYKSSHYFSLVTCSAAQIIVVGSILWFWHHECCSLYYSIHFEFTKDFLIQFLGQELSKVAFTSYNYFLRPVSSLP